MSVTVILEENIKLGVEVSDWMDAMKKSGQLLVDSKFITKDYIDLTIKTVEEYGPYIVIAPGLALSHSRPDVSVLKSGVSLLTLKEPVNFNSDNDPVNIVFTLASINDEDHLKLLEQLSCYLSEEGKIEEIAKCTDAKKLAEEINNYVVS